MNVTAPSFHVTETITVTPAMATMLWFLSGKPFGKWGSGHTEKGMHTSANGTPIHMHLTFPAQDGQA